MTPDPNIERTGLWGILVLVAASILGIIFGLGLALIAVILWGWGWVLIWWRRLKEKFER